LSTSCRNNIHDGGGNSDNGDGNNSGDDHNKSNSSKCRDDKNKEIEEIQGEDETVNAPGEGKVNKVVGDDATANRKSVHYVFLPVMMHLFVTFCFCFLLHVR
jgi:hypothetical protein